MQFRDAAMLWNMAESGREAAGTRRSRARDRRGAARPMPGSRARTVSKWCGQFAEQHFVNKGLAVQLRRARPAHEGEAESEHANWHAHLLITTRRLDGDRFAAKKARDLDPEVRRSGGRAIVADGEAWGELWRDHQNRYFREHGIDLEVDPTAVHPAPHIGPVRDAGGRLRDRRARRADPPGQRGRRA